MLTLNQWLFSFAYFLWQWGGPQEVVMSQTSQRNSICHKTSCTAYKAGKEKEGGVMMFVFPTNHYTWWESYFPGGTPACRWEVVNEFVDLLCLCAQLLLSQLNCLYHKPWAFSFLIFWFSPPSWHRSREWLYRAYLPDRVKPGQFFLMSSLGLEGLRLACFTVC